MPTRLLTHPQTPPQLELAQSMPCHKHEHLQHLGLGFPGLGLGGRPSCPQPPSQTHPRLLDRTNNSIVWRTPCASRHPARPCPPRRAPCPAPWLPARPTLLRPAHLAPLHCSEWASPEISQKPRTPRARERWIPSTGLGQSGLLHTWPARRGGG